MKKVGARDVTFSVIVGLYNHIQYIPKLIESLENQVWKDFDVIFCDDGSTDRTREWFTERDDHNRLPLFKFQYKYLWQKNRGARLAKSINRGFKLGTGHHFVVIMGDSFLEHNWLMNMAYYRNQNFLLCGVRAQIDGHRAVDIDWRLKKGLIPNDDKMILVDPFYCLTGNGLVFSRKIYETVGGWNEKIKGYGGDDVDFIARVYYAGFPCWSIASAILYHNWHKSRETEAVNSEMVNKLIAKYAKK